MILHLLRMRRNVNRNVFNDRKNVSATTFHGLCVVDYVYEKHSRKHILLLTTVVCFTVDFFAWYIVDNCTGCA